MKVEPFAFEIFRRFLRGETIAGLSLELGISPQRIEARIRAAAVYQSTHPEMRQPATA